MIRYRAPGRVNLIGEHVDYVGGLVLPAALDQGVTVAGVARKERIVELTSSSYPGRATIDLRTTESTTQGWARYVEAVAHELRVQGLEPPGFVGTIESDLPSGSGLSSSAALELAVAGALAHAAGTSLEGLELAKLGQRAEHRAVGVPCGIMDQAASALGRRNHALLLDCETLSYRHVALPSALSLVVLDTGVRRSLEYSAYARRRDEIEGALRLLPPGIARAQPEDALAAARRAGLDALQVRRLRHVVTENARVSATVAALERPEGPDTATLGSMFAESHASLRDDFEVSIPELDLLVELALEEGAVAARMTGGGFGGAIVALADTAKADDLAERTSARFARSTGRPAAVLVSWAGDGAGVLEAD